MSKQVANESSVADSSKKQISDSCRLLRHARDMQQTLERQIYVCPSQVTWVSCP